jgi:hypothetical protein
MRAGLTAIFTTAAAPGPSDTVAAESPGRFMGPEAEQCLAHGQAARPLSWQSFFAENLIVIDSQLALPVLAVHAPLGQISTVV